MRAKKWFPKLSDGKAESPLRKRINEKSWTVDEIVKMYGSWWADKLLLLLRVAPEAPLGCLRQTRWIERLLGPRHTNDSDKSFPIRAAWVAHVL